MILISMKRFFFFFLFFLFYFIYASTFIFTFASHVNFIYASTLVHKVDDISHKLRGTVANPLRPKQLSKTNFHLIHVNLEQNIEFFFIDE